MNRFKDEIIYYESNAYKKVIGRHDCRNCALLLETCFRFYHDTRDIKLEVFGYCKDDEIWIDLKTK